MCPDAGSLANFAHAVPQNHPVSTPVEPQGILEWAASKLDFTPSPKQAEILTSEAKSLILCLENALP
ncbi:MAG: hypothetical protein JNM66_18820 [Bryobacterales bacterium]|nr:hypothetical protein [Bryobacterales bacterium]